VPVVSSGAHGAAEADVLYARLQLPEEAVLHRAYWSMSDVGSRDTRELKVIAQLLSDISYLEDVARDVELAAHLDIISLVTTDDDDADSGTNAARDVESYEQIRHAARAPFGTLSPETGVEEILRVNPPTEFAVPLRIVYRNPLEMWLKLAGTSGAAFIAIVRFLALIGPRTPIATAIGSDVESAVALRTTARESIRKSIVDNHPVLRQEPLDVTDTADELTALPNLGPLLRTGGALEAVELVRDEDVPEGP
jgi:hypothetical protein